MHVLAIDAGTTGVTALVLDANRQVVGRAYAEFTQHHPQPGWVEHDADEIHRVVLDVAKKACKAAKVKPKDLVAVGITNQRETTVLWDRATGEPVHRALVWQDRRTAKACGKVSKRWQKKIRERTGLVVDPYFSATKLQWLLDEVPGVRKRAQAGKLAFGTIDTWLAWKLTGEHVTDPTNASRTMLWDIHQSAWDAELLELFGVPAEVLPDVVPSSHVIGPCKDLGGAPLAALVGDQQAALFGQGCTAPGEAKNTYGTGCFLLQHTGAEAAASKHGLLTTRAASLDDTAQFALEGSVFVGGAAIQWLRDGLQIIEHAPEVNDVAEADAGGVVVVPAFAGLGAPHWDPDARGAILGLTAGTGRGHIARATLEAIAFQSSDVLNAMEKDSGHKLAALRVDGGASQSDVLMQFQADLLGRPVERAAMVESTALGAGLLAGIAVGAWGPDASPPAGDRFEASAKRRDARAQQKAWQKAVKAVRSYKP